MKVSVVAPYDFSPKMRVGQIVELDNIRRCKNSESGYLVRVIGVWKKPRWFDANWFVLPEEAAQQKRALDGFKRSPDCTCDTEPHSPWCPDSKRRK